MEKRGQQQRDRWLYKRHIPQRELIVVAEIEGAAEARVVIDHYQRAEREQRQAEGERVEGDAFRAEPALFYDFDYKRRGGEQIDRVRGARADYAGGAYPREGKERFARGAL